MSLNCENRLVQNVVNDCSTFVGGGIEQDHVWLINRADLDVVYDSTNDVIVKSLTVNPHGTALSAIVYKLVGNGNNIDCGHDRVVTDGLPDMFTHNLSFKAFEWTSAGIKNLDQFGDVVAVVKRKSKKLDESLEIYGLEGGLYVTTDTARANTDNMTRSFELASKEGALETHSTYVYLESVHYEGEEAPSTVAEKVAAGIAYLDSLVE